LALILAGFADPLVSWRVFLCAADVHALILGRDITGIQAFTRNMKA
jgi:hypothetical protein